MAGANVGRQYEVLRTCTIILRSATATLVPGTLYTWTEWERLCCCAEHPGHDTKRAGQEKRGRNKKSLSSLFPRPDFRGFEDPPESFRGLKKYHTYHGVTIDVKLSVFSPHNYRLLTLQLSAAKVEGIAARIPAHLPSFDRNYHNHNSVPQGLIEPRVAAAL
jgi:hypothetical protein